MQARRRHRALYWAGVLLAAAAVAWGAALAYVSYAATAGPDGAVKGYFAALARADAPAALGYGDLPAGPRTLLTSPVLAEQQRLAPIGHLQVTQVTRSGQQATVSVRYQLGFAAGPQLVSDTLTVVHRDGGWRLSATAASTSLQLRQAADRASILGAPVPTVPTLFFPGALPIRLDSGYLQLDPATSVVRLGADPQTPVTVQPSQAGVAAMTGAVAKALAGCLRGSAQAPATCPLPDARAVPGTLTATLTDTVDRKATVTVEDTAAGALLLTARLSGTGTYQELDFNDLPAARTGPLTLPVTARAYPRPPLAVTWQQAVP